MQKFYEYSIFPQQTQSISKEKKKVASSVSPVKHRKYRTLLMQKIETKNFFYKDAVADEQKMYPQQGERLISSLKSQQRHEESIKKGLNTVVINLKPLKIEKALQMERIVQAVRKKNIETREKTKRKYRKSEKEIRAIIEYKSKEEIPQKISLTSFIGQQNYTRGLSEMMMMEIHQKRHREIKIMKDQRSMSRKSVRIDDFGSVKILPEIKKLQPADTQHKILRNIETIAETKRRSKQITTKIESRAKFRKEHGNFYRDDYNIHGWDSNQQERLGIYCKQFFE